MSEAWEAVNPRGDQIVVVRDQIEETPGKIIIPETSRDVAGTGRVKRIGPEVKDIRVDDRVLFGPWDGMTTRIDGKSQEPFLLMAASCVRAIIEEVSGNGG